MMMFGLRTMTTAKTFPAGLLFKNFAERRITMIYIVFLDLCCKINCSKTWSLKAHLHWTWLWLNERMMYMLSVCKGAFRSKWTVVDAYEPCNCCKMAIKVIKNSMMDDRQNEAELWMHGERKGTFFLEFKPFELFCLFALQWPTRDWLWLWFRVMERGWN